MNNCVLLMVATVVIAAFIPVILRLRVNKVYDSVKQELFNRWAMLCYLLLAAIVVLPVIAFFAMDYEHKHLMFMMCSVAIASLSQITLKMGAGRNYASVIREYFNPCVVIGYGMMVLTTALTVLAYMELDYKNGPVIESVGYILVMVLSCLFFREKITLRKLLGNLMILAGVFVFYL